MDLMKALTSQYMKEELPQMNVGDTVRVHGNDHCPQAWRH